jgi:AbrB family looped-hinge helix DNA binding protein
MKKGNATTLVTAKGQVTIPKHIRDRKGIAAGTRLEVVERGGEIVLRKPRRATSRRAARDEEFEAYIERVRGSMDIGMSTDEFMELLRGE